MVTHARTASGAAKAQRPGEDRHGGPIEVVAVETSTSTRDWATAAMAHFKQTGCVDTRRRLEAHYMAGLVMAIARQVSSRLPACVESEDLAQAAFEGLRDCLDRFQLDRGVRFETFSRRRITGAMHDYLRRQDVISRQARTRTKKIRRAIEEFCAQHGRPPTLPELRLRLDMTEQVFESALRDAALPGTISFQGLDDGNDDSNALSSLSDRRKATATADPDRMDLRRWVCQFLDDRDTLILSLYYYDQLTMREVGKVVGCSESRISQRLDSIHGRLRVQLGDRPDVIAHLKAV